MEELYRTLLIKANDNTNKLKEKEADFFNFKTKEGTYINGKDDLYKKKYALLTEIQKALFVV